MVKFTRRALKLKINGLIPFSIPVWALLLWIVLKKITGMLPGIPLRAEAASMPLVVAAASAIFVALFGIALWRAMRGNSTEGSD